MKLSKDIISRIDEFFERMTPEELYELSITKYGFTPESRLDLNDQPFGIISQTIYANNSDNLVDFSQEKDTIPLAA